MKLYLVQDDERPLYVAAENYGEAVERWQRQIAEECCTAADEVVEQPSRVDLIAEEDEIMWPGQDLAELRLKPAMEG